MINRYLQWTHYHKQKRDNSKLYSHIQYLCTIQQAQFRKTKPTHQRINTRMDHLCCVLNNNHPILDKYSAYYYHHQNRIITMRNRYYQSTHKIYYKRNISKKSWRVTMIYQRNNSIRLQIHHQQKSKTMNNRVYQWSQNRILSPLQCTITKQRIHQNPIYHMNHNLHYNNKTIQPESPRTKHINTTLNPVRKIYNYALPMAPFTSSTFVQRNNRHRNAHLRKNKTTVLQNQITFSFLILHI